MSQVATSSAKPHTVAELLTSNGFKKQIALALPKHMNPERMARIALTELRKNPKLSSCNIQSFACSILNASQAGLELGGIFGQAYLVPYGNECQLIIGFRGMVELAHRSGKIVNINADIVRLGDEFEYQNGRNPDLKHKPMMDEGKPITHVYACASLANGGFQFVVMTKQEVDRISSKSKSKNIWNEHYAEMAKKTAIRRLFKMLPVSAELAKVIALDDASERGEIIDLASYETGEDTFDDLTQNKSDTLLSQIEGE
jgi:recombination protein RecT